MDASRTRRAFLAWGAGMTDRTTLIIVAVLVLLFIKSKRRQAGAKVPLKLPATPPQKIPATPQKIVTPKAGGWLAYREQLARQESAGDYAARRPGSQYWGRYQLGALARRAGGAKGVRWAQFKTDQALQDKTAAKWTARNLTELQAQPTARAAVKAGTKHGVPVSWASLVAMDHLTGRGATMKWLRTGKTTKDGAGVINVAFARPFLRFDLSELKGVRS